MRGTVAAVAAAAAALLPAGGPVVYGYPYASRCPAGGVAERVDRWHMYVCNCTSYAAWALAANGQRTDWFVAGAMDASNWPHVARLRHIPVGTSPRVGAIAVWPHLSRFGHVAYVTRVDADGRFDVGEYNLPGAAEPFGFDTRTEIPTAGATFVYVPRRSTRTVATVVPSVRPPIRYAPATAASDTAAEPRTRSTVRPIR